jgi:hypothetical protein
VESTSGRVVQAALEYASFGWRVVPLHGVSAGVCSCSKGDKCGSAGKHPRINEWQKQASTDEDRIAAWFDKWPEANVGIQMGQSSGIIDFETDSAQGEAELALICGGKIPITPTFTSGRGKHRLFKWRDDLPAAGTIPLGWGDVKLGADGKGSQSVFPPSRHSSGKDYRWLVSPDQAAMAAIPDALFAFIHNVDPHTERKNGKKTVDDWQQIARPRREGEGRNIAFTQLIGGTMRQWGDLESPASLELLFQAVSGFNRANKPPMDDQELNQAFKSILNKEKQRRVQEAADGVLARTPEERIAEATKQGIRAPQSMKLVIVRDDPPAYELHGPQFEKAKGGCIRLTASQLCSFEALKVAALEQADYPLPKEFKKTWDARGGLFEQLVFAAEEREVNAATKRLATAAEYLLVKLDQAVACKDDGAPDRTLPTRMEDGTIWFRWTEIWRDAVLGGTVHRDDPKRLAHSLTLGARAQKRWPPRGGHRKRYVVFDKQLMAKLEAIAECEDDAPAESPKEGIS